MTEPICIEPTLAGRLPFYLTTYVTAEVIEQAAAAHSIDPFTLAALLDRETLGGTTKDLDKPGPSGTGDFGKRDPAHWGSELPPDGRGWGRGLFQIDYSKPGSPQRAWCETVAADGRCQWEVPALNADKAAELFAGKLAVLANDYQAAICAYNAGEGSAQRALAALPPDAGPLRRVAALDAVTTGGNYVSDVLKRRDGYLKTVPPQES